MKHLLNDLSSEERSSILEQHTGGKTFDTSKFKKLMESKLGEVKPLITEAEQFVIVDADETDADIVNMCVDATDADLLAAGVSTLDGGKKRKKRKKCNAGKIKSAGSGKTIKYYGNPWP
jgi:hypothetical protein